MTTKVQGEALVLTACLTKELTLQEKLEKLMAQETGPRFLGVPDRWFDARKLRCVNDHVSRTYLKSELHGSLCLACGEPVYLSYPEDEEGPFLWPEERRRGHT